VITFALIPKIPIDALPPSPSGIQALGGKIFLAIVDTVEGLQGPFLSEKAEG